MTGRTTDRRVKTKSTTNQAGNSVTGFTLPESLPCSEKEFPILLRKKNIANWNEILQDSAEFFQNIQVFEENKADPKPKSPFLRTECDYLQQEVFPYLVPALEETLQKAKIWNAFYNQNCFFNGIDHIAQVLWNNNPRHPARQNDQHIFNMSWVRNLLKIYPRPLYPKSWLWPENYAAIMIQKTVRQYFVQRIDEVQEMREFWKKLQMEQNLPEIEINPLLSKKFASSQHTENH